MTNASQAGIQPIQIDLITAYSTHPDYPYSLTPGGNEKFSGYLPFPDLPRPGPEYSTETKLV